MFSIDKVKILHITNNYPTSNYPIFGIFVKEQIDSLKDLGHANDIFFINGKEGGKIEYVKSIFRLKKYLNEREYDIIHCHHALSALCLLFSSNPHKFKSVVSYQNDPVNELGKYVYRFIKSRVSAIILKNRSHIVDHTSVFHLSNGVNISFFQEIPKNECYSRLKLRSDKRYILFVSSNFIRQQKRYDRFKKVLSILRDKYKLHDLEELKLINTDREIVPYYFNIASLHLLTSDFEGSPNSVKEAMACNTPVVSTNVGDVSALLSGINRSFVSISNDADELAELTYQALTIDSDINSRNMLIKKNLDINSVAKRLTQIYSKILST